MGLMPWEKTTTCPYNPAHQITIERIQSHLIKCRRNHPNSNHVICPFNASHHIPQPEERFHLANCPDRRIVEREKYSWAVENSRHGYLKLPVNTEVHTSSDNFLQDDLEVEDWERELSGSRVKSYDPQKKCEKAAVIRKPPPGATPSDRKKFYIAERARHEQLNELEETQSNDDAPGDFHSPRPTLFREERPTLSLRRPTITENEDFFSPRPTLFREERPTLSLRRPNITEGEGGDSSNRPTLLRDKIQEEAVKEKMTSARQGSITSRLLHMVGKRLEPAATGTDLQTPNDTIDSKMGNLVLDKKDVLDKLRRPRDFEK